MKRQRGRGRRSGGGNNNNPNRHFESTGPDVKIRGSAQQILDKYQQYARDAQSSGDRVNAENYLQHAEHYYRVLAAMQPKDKPRDDTRAPSEDDNAVAESGDANTEAKAESDGDTPRRSNNRRRKREDREPDAAKQAETSSEIDTTATPEDSVEASEAPKARPRRNTRRKPVEAETTADAASEDKDDGVMKTLSRGRRKPSAEVEGDRPAETQSDIVESAPEAAAE